ncbi:MAG TPA: type VI secretion system protein IglI family protein [Myxococcales bacterium]|jgi:hypothetical protein
MAEPLSFDLLDGPWPDGDDLEATDPRLEAVATLVADGAYVDAGHAAAEILREAPDVRVAGAYLFAAFLERGMEALPDLLQSTLRLLTSEWETLRPKAKREIAAGTSLRWLFRSLVKHLEHHERERDDAWKAFCDERNAAPVTAALQLVEPVATAMAERIAAHGAVEAYRHFAAWLAKHAQLLATAASEDSPAAAKGAAQPAAAQTGAVASNGDGAPGADELAGLDNSEATHGAHTSASASLPDANGANGASLLQTALGPARGIPISPALAALQDKLRSFEVLVERGDFQKAGIIAADVLAIVDHFDPRLYLPSLFARFFAALSEHASALEPIVEGQSSLELRALQHLYHSNLGAFVSGPERKGNGEPDVG